MCIYQTISCNTDKSSNCAFFLQLIPKLNVTLSSKVAGLNWQKTKRPLCEDSHLFKNSEWWTQVCFISNLVSPVIFKTAYLYVCQTSSVLIPTITLSSSSVCFPAAECWFQPLFLQTSVTVTAAVGDIVGCICKVSFRFLSFFSPNRAASQVHRSF